MYGVIDDPRHTRMTLTDRPWRLRAVAKSRSLSTKIHSSKRVASLSAQSSKQHTVSSVTAHFQHTPVTGPHSRTLASLERYRHADGADRSSSEAARRSPGSDARRSAPVVASASPQTRHPTTARDGTATRTPNRTVRAQQRRRGHPPVPNGPLDRAGNSESAIVCVHGETL